MNKKDIKLSHKAIESYCKEEQRMQIRVYKPKVESGKMDEYKANRNYLIIQELKELNDDLKAKGITWKELRKMVGEISNKKTFIQKKLFPQREQQ